jgi:hypothetical protein
VRPAEKAGSPGSNIACQNILIAIREWQGNSTIKSYWKYSTFEKNTISEEALPRECCP